MADNKDKAKQGGDEKTRSFLSALSPKEVAQLRAHFKLEGPDEISPDAAERTANDDS